MRAERPFCAPGRVLNGDEFKSSSRYGHVCGCGAGPHVASNYSNPCPPIMPPVWHIVLLWYSLPIKRVVVRHGPTKDLVAKCRSLDLR
ncbi:hypothetical protein PISMIDRAFT_468761 [Pisolithus microcarpus 441]|uniref:Uncharacterized protein n=1 Tax=Pisolithus microcarpus 441 TaxID=765257 RepID=A0A0C9XHZ2_9AGAM|nr:hypothetical protein PISMIDRAFT_468761 [Pisolithus microcarpus 441]